MSVGLAAAIGCGGSFDVLPRAAVTGTVTLDGQPLESGTIRFVPAAPTGGPKTSTAIMNGWFDLPSDVGPVIGRHRVEIETPPAGEIAMDDEQALERLQRAGRKARIDVVRIPAVYNSNSQLTADIAATEFNQLSFDLRSKPRQ
ncbi:MAG: hypothetical protein RIK87_03110 [Fuerstiella sp.]